MTIGQHITQLGGKPVTNFRKAGDISDFGAVAARIYCDYEDEKSLAEYLNGMLAEPSVENLSAFVVGAWPEGYDTPPTDILQAMARNAHRFPNLRSFFMGDITFEENEMSWIQQGDYRNFWIGFPQFEEITLRGVGSLQLGSIKSRNLKSFTLQTGGLPNDIAKEALAIDAPLEHFELWLGSDRYGGDTTIKTFEDLFEGRLFPDMTTLGLKNSQYTDIIAEVLIDAPVMERITHLDLSMGTLTDRGANALLNAPWIGKLEGLDLGHHYMTPETAKKMIQANPRADVSDPQKPDDMGDGEIYYYIGVSE